jgi:MarR family transcriptional regulator, transcriptional regulator for hemolysin
MPIAAPDLMLLLHVASHTLETELAVRLAELGITPRENCVLSKALGHELTQSELAEQCNLDKTTMVVTIDSLERAGLAERLPSSTDRRARIIAVTAAGERMTAKAERVVAKIYDDVLSNLADDQRKAFVQALTQLAEGRLSTPMQCDKPPRRRAARAPQVVR